MCSRAAGSDLWRFIPLGLTQLATALADGAAARGVQIAGGRIHRPGVLFPYLDNDLSSCPYRDTYAELARDVLGVKIRMSSVGFSAQNAGLTEMHRRIVAELGEVFDGIRFSLTPYATGYVATAPAPPATSTPLTSPTPRGSAGRCWTDRHHRARRARRAAGRAAPGRPGTPAPAQQRRRRLLQRRPRLPPRRALHHPQPLPGHLELREERGFGRASLSTVRGPIWRITPLPFTGTRLPAAVTGRKIAPTEQPTVLIEGMDPCHLVLVMRASGWRLRRFTLASRSPTSTAPPPRCAGSSWNRSRTTTTPGSDPRTAHCPLPTAHCAPASAARRDSAA
ncbi:hypothetical protein [Kitasatospora sp. MMS16-BH015]|uniref:hypothetical protein n=1 Tax=Kitasatospora sp. MMS16-BH015 TaxID=2018025 RepID=UPI00131A5114|nr:hypothetical protein [Kitasatospora sp. MMS16-BH015]